MAINNDLLNDIISGLSSMPKKSEIDTPTHNIDLDATETESGLMSAADKKKLNTIEDNANFYEHPTGSGNFHIPSGGKSGQILKWTDDGEAKWSTESTYSNATDTIDGLMSASDKANFDAIVAKVSGISDSANNYVLPIATKDTLGGVKTASGVDDATGLTPVPIINGIPYYKNTIEYELPIASNTTLGGIKTTSEVTSTTGLTACPIIAGIPYYKDAQSTAVDYTDDIVFNTDAVEKTYTTKILKIGCFVNFIINITVKEASTSLRVVIGTLPEQVRPIDNVVNNTVSNTGRGCYVYADTDGSFGFTLTEDSISSSSSTVSIDGWAAYDGVRLNLTYLTNPD